MCSTFVCALAIFGTDPEDLVWRGQELGDPGDVLQYRSVRRSWSSWTWEE
ncbi:hypothetical protein [Streptomyces cadmiisoli]